MCPTYVRLDKMTHTDIFSLMHKRLTGEITSLEESQLDALLEQQDQEKIASDLEEIWESAESYKPSVNFNSAQAFGKLMDRISEEEALPTITSKETKVISIHKEVKKESPRMFSIQGLARVAAIGVFLFASYLTFDRLTHSTIESGDTTMFASLEDGTSIWLAPNSSIRYKKSFENNRKVDLKGKAFFDVARDEAHPFTIESDDIDVTVLGTSFTVEDSKVNVVSGKVAVALNDSEVVLTKGQAVDMSISNTVKDVDVKPLAWINPSLSFDNASLDDVIKQLALHFDKKISYKGRRDLSSCLFSATDLSEESLDDILDVLKATFNVTIERDEKKGIILSKAKCR